MNQDAVFAFSKLFLDVRLLSGEGNATPDERFAQALALADDSCAGAWMRYCCKNLRLLVRSDLRAAYDFADAVHNTRYLKGLEDGLLLWPKSYWDIQIEPFREWYGQEYFADFAYCVLPDEEVEQRCPDASRTAPRPAPAAASP